MCDKWWGASFVEGASKAAVIISGRKGLGPNGYGNDPDSCMPGQGYHCDPFERQVIFYDVEELGQAAAGIRDAWTVVPYMIWRPTQFFSRDARGHSCGELGGMTVDRAGSRLFMVEKGLGDNNEAVVHVWSVSGK
jgi:hypothetical protein